MKNGFRSLSGKKCTVYISALARQSLKKLCPERELEYSGEVIAVDDVGIELRYALSPKHVGKLFLPFNSIAGITVMEDK